MLYRIGKYRGMFAVVWHDTARGTQRRSLGIPARKENRERAETGLEEFKANLRQAAAKPAGPITIGRCLDGYFEDHPGVIYRSVVRNHFGAMLPEHVDKAACKEYIAKRLKAGISPTTINDELGLIRTAVKWAKAEGWTMADPPEVHRPQRRGRRERWITPEQALTLIRSAATPHVRLFILMALHTTARTSSILELTWSRVSFDLKRIDFNVPGAPRTRKRRAVVKMTREIAQVLQAAREIALTDHVIEYGGKPVKSIKTGFQNAVERAGLDRVTPHTLRHSAATWMKQRKVASWDAAGMLGNSVKMVDEVYAHHDPDYMDDATAAIEAALDPRSAPPVHLNRFAGNKSWK